MSEQDDILIAEAEIGEEARKFIESDLGRCILGIAKQEAQEALEKLAETLPTDIEGIMELQGAVKMCRAFEQWLIELISKGENAVEIWKNGQTDE